MLTNADSVLSKIPARPTRPAPSPSLAAKASTNVSLVTRSTVAQAQRATVTSSETADVQMDADDEGDGGADAVSGDSVGSSDGVAAVDTNEWNSLVRGAEAASVHSDQTPTVVRVEPRRPASLSTSASLSSSDTDGATKGRGRGGSNGGEPSSGTTSRRAKGNGRSKRRGRDRARSRSSQLGEVTAVQRRMQELHMSPSASGDDSDTGRRKLSSSHYSYKLGEGSPALGPTISLTPDTATGGDDEVGLRDTSSVAKDPSSPATAVTAVESSGTRATLRTSLRSRSRETGSSRSPTSIVAAANAVAASAYRDDLDGSSPPGKPGQISHRRTASLPDEFSHYRHEGSPNTTGYGSSSDSDSDPSDLPAPARAASAAPSSQQRRMLHSSTGSFTRTSPRHSTQVPVRAASQSHTVHHQRRASASVGRRADSPTFTVPERPQSSLGLPVTPASQLEAAKLENQLLHAELQRSREQLRLAQSAPTGKAWALPRGVNLRVPFL